MTLQISALNWIYTVLWHELLYMEPKPVQTLVIIMNIIRNDYNNNTFLCLQPRNFKTLRTPNKCSCFTCSFLQSGKYSCYWCNLVFLFIKQAAQNCTVVSGKSTSSLLPNKCFNIRWTMISRRRLCKCTLKIQVFIFFLENYVSVNEIYVFFIECNGHLFHC